MADQDQDGSHIKGLVINFIHTNWPNLLKHNFVVEFITPIVKVRTYFGLLNIWLYGSVYFLPFCHVYFQVCLKWVALRLKKISWAVSLGNTRGAMSMLIIVGNKEQEGNLFLQHTRV